VRDKTVSSRHCEIVEEARGVRVRDLGSRNGTYIGGARVPEGWVVEDSTIIVGKTVLVCQAVGNEDDEETGRPLPGVAGASRVMCRLAMRVRRLANVAAPVLVAGESGVGKELIARALHALGPRAGGPFVALNASAIPRDLVETELFGHEKGAFTGAVNRRLGAFVEAEGGTLFLDEIGDLSIDAQPKLLRALDGYEVRRVGASGSGRRTDVRVIVATHVPLFERVEAGCFRRDLFHRLEVFVVQVPPLRERPGDVLPIAKALLEGMGADFGPRELTTAAIAQLTSYHWPGNVRELKGVLMRAADVAAARKMGEIDAASVLRALRPVTTSALGVSPDRALSILQACDGNISEAARRAGLPRTTFRKLAMKAGGAVE
jgi:DNA-binding NtrC family response regulator